MFDASFEYNTLVVNNNFVIPQIWRIFRENHIKAQIVLPIQMDAATSKWSFNANLYELKDKKDRLVSESIIKWIEPLDYIKDFPHIIKVDYSRYSIKKCLDWLTANLNDDQWLLDDFRGEKSSLMDSRYPIPANGYWAMKTVAIFFARQEDLNFFRVLQEHFYDDN